jgi:hypothetical protein
MVLTLIGILGGALNFVALLPFGWMAALIGAPFGASLLTLAVAGLILGVRREATQIEEASGALHGQSHKQARNPLGQR